MNEIIGELNYKVDDQLFIKRDYLNHQYISGNKLRKLKYNILEAKKEKKDTLLSFGGAYSNHISALAYAGKLYNFNTIGVIRGDELELDVHNNPTLSTAFNNGMILKFISRKLYRQKTSAQFIKSLEDEFGTFYMLPEGGTNNLAVKGCEEILTEEDAIFDFICCPVGTGGTISGLINSSGTNHKVLGFPALKGDFLNDEINRFAKLKNWELITDYHFGGYAKINEELVSFINQFKVDFDIQLDPIYTGKMMFGIVDLFKKGFFKKDSKVLAIHTGGLQSILGMNDFLKKKNLPVLV